MILLLFITACAVVWQLLTGWLFLDCLYFAFATFTTIGFGDINPVNIQDVDDEEEKGENHKILMEVQPEWNRQCARRCH